MADLELKDFDDKLAENVRAYARQRRSTLTKWFESAAQHELNNVGSTAPWTVRQTAGRDAVQKYVRHGDVNFGDINFMTGKFFSDIRAALKIDKLLELPASFWKGCGIGFGGGVLSAGGVFALVHMPSLHELGRVLQCFHTG